MENYVTKSIFLFNLLFLIACNRDNISYSIIEVQDAEVIIDISLPTETIIPIKIKSGPCLDDMVYVKSGNFCMDTYEYPNKKDEYPDYAMSAYNAEIACKTIDKRLCTHTEWVSACIGSKKLSYGYSNHWIPNVCNDTVNTNYIPVDWSRMDDPIAWKKYAHTLYKGVKSGSKEGCFSTEDEYKIYDLIGNVREWVKDPYGYGGYSFESSFWYGTMEGPQGCGFTVRNHDPGFATYEAATRCCSNIH